MKNIGYILLGAFFSLNIFAADVVANLELSPAGSFDARCDKIRGKIEKTEKGYKLTKAIVKVGCFKTGIELRDEHLHKRLGGKRKKIIIKNAVGNSGKGTSTIELNGTSQVVPFTYTVKEKVINVKLSISAKSFKLEGLRYLSVGVKDKIIIEANLSVK